MRLKILAMTLSAAAAVSGCASNPTAVESTPPPAMDAPMPAPMQAPASMSLHDSVHAALQAGLGDAGSGIEVRVEGTKVYLTGHVATSADHDRAHDIAHDVAGVTEVDHSGLVVP